jgi:Helix-turn-helix domain
MTGRSCRRLRSIAVFGGRWQEKMRSFYRYVITQKLAWTLRDAAERCGVSYWSLYRAACRGDLKVIKGFGRMMVSEAELSRFLSNATEYLPRRRKPKS